MEATLAVLNVGYKGFPTDIEENPDKLQCRYLVTRPRIETDTFRIQADLQTPIFSGEKLLNFSFSYCT
jgi:hypothetical protein